MNKFSLLLLYGVGLCLTTLVNAGELQGIQADSAHSLSIRYNDCQFDNIVAHTATSLHIQLKNCQTKAGSLTPNTTSVFKKITWKNDTNATAHIELIRAQAGQYQVLHANNETLLCVPHCGTTLPVKKPPPTSFNYPNLLHVNGLTLISPLEKMPIAEFLDRSIGFIPKDAMRDGLPHFGSKRDDWLGKNRRHRGYDIYIDNINVLASADGEVVRVAKGRLSGLYVKVKHANNIHTVYVHLANSKVKQGDKVKQGQVLGRISGAQGNAISAQLHYEVKINDKSVDPLPLIKAYFAKNAAITDKITAYETKIPHNVAHRKQQVAHYLAEQAVKTVSNTTEKE